MKNFSKRILAIAIATVILVVNMPINTLNSIFNLEGNAGEALSILTSDVCTATEGNSQYASDTDAENVGNVDETATNTSESANDEDSETKVIIMSDEVCGEEENEATATSTDASGEEEIMVVSAIATVNTLLSSVMLLATSSSTCYLTDEGNLTVYNAAGYATVGSTFHVTVSGNNYPAYCGDHDYHSPGSGTFSYYEVTSGNTENASNVRKVIAYVIDTYGNSYNAISDETRVRISIAVNNAKHGTSLSLGKQIQEAAYEAYSSEPLSASDVAFSVGSSELTSTTGSTVKITVKSTGKEVEVYSPYTGDASGKLTFSGSTNNRVTVTLPSGVYMRYNSTDWAGPGETVTINPGSIQFVQIAVDTSFTGTTKLTFTGKNGYTVYYLEGGSGNQNIYWGTKTSAQTTTVTVTREEKQTGSIYLKKVYSTGFGISYCSYLSGYSLEGAEYEVYTTTGNGGSKGTHIATFETSDNGTGYVSWSASGYSASSDKVYLNGIDLDSWVYIIETKASKGCKLDSTVHYAQITSATSAVKVTSTEPVEPEPMAITIQKTDYDTDEPYAAGAGSLSGAEFTVKYYDVDPEEITSYDELVASGASEERTWTFETDEYGYIDCLQYEYYTGGDNLYWSGNTIVLPYGVITVEETSAPKGYTTSGAYFFGTDGEKYSDGIIFATITEKSGLRYYTGTNFINSDNITLIKEEIQKRADIKFIKVNAETGEILSGVTFNLTSLTTGESHILVTDEYGVIDTSSITTGYLAYDTYVLSEIDTDANDGYILAEDIIIDLTDDSLYNDGYYFLDLGNVTNIPEPVLGTRAFSIDTEDNVIPADSSVIVYDEVSYSYLTAGNTYTIKGIIMDAETGLAYADVDGNYVTGIKIFEVDSDYDSYPEEKCGKINVKYEINTAGLAGKNLVVFEYLYEGENTAELTVNSDGVVEETGVYETNTGTFVKHTDLTDENQTLHIPAICTTLTDSETNDHISNADEEVILTDTVSYDNLTPGREYTVNGVLMNKSTGEELLDADGNPVISFVTFTAENSSGSIDVVFTFDASLLAGTSTVAFETVYYNDAEIAVHADIDDMGQTVNFSEITEEFETTEELEISEEYETPKTGDTIMLSAVVGIFIMAVFLVLILLIIKRKNMVNKK